MNMVVVQRTGSLFPWEFCRRVARSCMESWLEEERLGEFEYESRAVTIESAREDYGVVVPSEVLR